MSRVWMELEGTQLGPEKSVSNQQGEDTGDDKEGGCGIFTKQVRLAGKLSLWPNLADTMCFLDSDFGQSERDLTNP